LPYGDPPRPHARCVYCGSLERHRTLWPHLQHTIKPGDRVLHFAPEPIIARNIATLMQVAYTAADLHPSHSWLAQDFSIVRADITAQPWPDGSFGVVIVSHVLEWVPDDVLAMQELRRVVADDGVVVSQEPNDPSFETTCENPTVTGPEPIVRIYGRDLISRWEHAGFEVQTFHAEAPPDDRIFEARPR
jgi:SAM-dependent methyltransferase